MKADGVYIYSIINLTKRPHWHLEDFYIPHTQITQRVGSTVYSNKSHH